MIGFSGISEIVIPIECVQLAYDHLRAVGEEGFEGVALFAGKQSHNQFRVSRALIPKQVALSIEHGLLYSVHGEELHRLNVFLFENELSLIAQVHSHPKEAFHSETDDAYPIVTTAGCISIVVPDFAAGPINIDSWAVYRLTEDSEWKKLSLVEQKKIIILH
jgi:hypothetical protein